MKIKGWIVNLLVLVSLLQAAQTSAWEQIRCITPANKDKKKHWADSVYKPVLDPATIPEGSPQYFAVLQAIDRMNSNPSQFRYVFGGMDNGDGIAINNGESEISMKDLGADFSKTSAIEQSDSDYSPTCTATESDIIINTHYRMARPPSEFNKLTYNNQKSQLFAYGGSYANFVSTVMHELGHSAGLQHEGDVLNLMGGNNLLIANGDRVEPYIGEDAASGLIALFGISASAQEDVSVSHWRYGDKLVLKDGSVFSLHHRTRLFDGKNIELTMACPYGNPDLNGPLITACPEPVYQVNKGQAVNLELSYENSGKTMSVGIVASYYFSTDNKIDETDTLLKTSKFPIKRDSLPSTISTKLNIPKTVVSGNHYWLGCHISPSRGALKESNENNNQTYVEIKIN
ncbi:hypothetical protein [Methyloglobulus sp.]|uniref:hypothetical protein n=1 Tax=Methyloglobulus sp. TaxID=2518622 RepID=UPI0032B85A10